MKQSSTIPSRRRRLLVAAAATLVVAPALLTAQGVPTPAPAAPTPAITATPQAAAQFAALKGSVIDSVHGGPLVSATVLVTGTQRFGLTNQYGEYQVDSIPPGKHQLVVRHALLDTLGITLRTPDYTFVAGQTAQLDVSVPGAEFLASRLCTPAQRMRGPAAMTGFVHDPDTGGPAVGAKVELVYDDVDPIGRKRPVVRSDLVDTTGFYRICGLPKDMTGKVQVFRNGVSSGEVPTEAASGFLALRAFSIVSAHQTVVEVTNDSGRVKRIAKGSARVTGRVLDKKGQPLSGARVMLQGGGTTAITKPNGEFVLDSLPSGTQALEVRKLGYSVTEVPVELSTIRVASTTITMDDAVPVLAAMRTEATADQALSDLGYLSRKQSGFGYFMDGKTINHDAVAFSDVMRQAPGLRITPAGDGRSYVITDSRNSNNGCVNFWVDGTQWQTMTPGDIDSYVRPDELVAVEVYHGSDTPPQFQTPGQGSCATIVAWTQARISTMTKRKKP
jgi:hypothetical protein